MIKSGDFFIRGNRGPAVQASAFGLEKFRSALLRSISRRFISAQKASDITWKEGVPGERTPESHVKKMSGKWLYGKPMSWLVINAVVFFGSVLRRLDWKITPIHDKLWYIAAFVLMLTITAFVLMLCRKKAGILLTLVTLASMFIAVYASRGTFSMLMTGGSMLPFWLFFIWLMCVMPYIRAMRLDRQIRERLTEY